MHVPSTYVLQQQRKRLPRRLFLQIADKIGLPGLYLHEAVEDESVEGTGNLIWTAGVRLSQHLVKNRGGELKGARVLDLGAGTGARRRVHTSYCTVHHSISWLPLHVAAVAPLLAYPAGCSELVGTLRNPNQ
jgi:hypothetical protein